MATSLSYSVLIEVADSTAERTICSVRSSTLNVSPSLATASILRKALPWVAAYRASPFSFGIASLNWIPCGVNDVGDYRLVRKLCKEDKIWTYNFSFVAVLIDNRPESLGLHETGSDTMPRYQLSSIQPATLPLPKN